jgi:hypothetical protein
MHPRPTLGSLGSNIDLLSRQSILLGAALRLAALATAIHAAGCSAETASPPMDSAPSLESGAVDTSAIHDISDVAPEAADGGADAPVDVVFRGDFCEFVNGRCPSICVEVFGAEYDPVGKCLKKLELLACHRTGLGPASFECRVRDGIRLYRFDGIAPNEPDVPGWTGCSDEQHNAVATASVPYCTL